jgi:hypothetical protein
MVGETTQVFAQPDLTGQDWARIRRGILVKVERRSGDSVQVTYEEADQLLDPQYITYRITGWVPDRALVETVTRHFYHLTYEGPAAGRWEVETDNHRFTLFWAPVVALPPIIPPQDAWLEMLKATDRSHLNRPTVAPEDTGFDLANYGERYAGWGGRLPVWVRESVSAVRQRIDLPLDRCYTT